MRVPATTDLMQSQEKLEVPEIRVWLHPHRRSDFKEDEDGSDYCQVFPTFGEALAFISEHTEAEPVPLVAFRGYELNLWAMEAQG